eukprot:TRINITY_DN1260_c0_g1_i6.p1 TRINITY_DN1260_c0_g1~~TRINITY_DN1260_c0_g1_i6.p1  ORF type:complete len:388 (+),score=55.65 TRINITY_DN1260_c0_g1_i6:540-1703(+)
MRITCRECPLCDTWFPREDIADHLDACLQQRRIRLGKQLPPPQELPNFNPPNLSLFGALAQLGFLSPNTPPVLNPPPTTAPISIPVPVQGGPHSSVQNGQQTSGTIPPIAPIGPQMIHQIAQPKENVIHPSVSPSTAIFYTKQKTACCLSSCPSLCTKSKPSQAKKLPVISVGATHWVFCDLGHFANMTARETISQTVTPPFKVAITEDLPANQDCALHTCPNKCKPILSLHCNDTISKGDEKRVRYFCSVACLDIHLPLIKSGSWNSFVNGSDESKNQFSDIYGLLSQDSDLFEKMCGLSVDQFDHLHNNLELELSRTKLGGDGLKVKMSNGRSRSLSTENQLLLFFIWMRQYVPEYFLGFLFQIAQSRVSDYIHTTLDIYYNFSS